MEMIRQKAAEAFVGDFDKGHQGQQHRQADQYLKEKKIGVFP